MSDVTIPGKSISSTIDTMRSLGSLGTEVLSSLGIEVIEPDKQYPVSVRSSIHDEALHRFGNDALISFGYGVFESYPEYGDNLRKLWMKLEKENQTLEKALEEFLTELTKIGNELLQSGTLGGTVKYCVSRTKLDNLKYETSITSAVPSRHYAYWEGTFLAHAVCLLSDSFEHSIVHISDRSDEGIGWAKIVFEEDYKIKETKEDLGVCKYNLRNQLNEKLISAVVGDANRQKQTAEAQTKKMEELSSQLGKYLPPQIHQAMLSGEYDKTITTRRRKLTIFFSDIKNFTSTSEGLQPEDLTKYLNEYFSEMTTIALSCGATIDKYIGDAMMLFFGDPGSRGEREDARAGVEMALKMQERMRELQTKWRSEGFADPFQVRMGMNTGYCNVGNFGSDQRLTYTIIGGEVNVAQRLEANADADGILMSYETFAHAQDMIRVEEREAIKMKGINREIKIFSVLGRAGDIAQTDSGEMQGALPNHVVLTKGEFENRLTSVEKDVGDIRGYLSELSRQIRNITGNNDTKL